MPPITWSSTSLGSSNSKLASRANKPNSFGGISDGGCDEWKHYGKLPPAEGRLFVCTIAIRKMLFLMPFPIFQSIPSPAGPIASKGNMNVDNHRMHWLSPNKIIQMSPQIRRCFPSFGFRQLASAINQTHYWPSADNLSRMVVGSLRDNHQLRCKTNPTGLGQSKFPWSSILQWHIPCRVISF